MITALFSRSGSTLGKVFTTGQILTNSLDEILTNNYDIDSYSRAIYPLMNKIKEYSHRDLEKYLLEIESTTVLLFGYMRILSQEVCEKHDIYNLHPGDIERYPELKGIDPIEKIFHETSVRRNIPFNATQGYELGCVIHKVIPEVDAGEIVRVQRYFAKDYKDAVIKSQEVAVDMWIDFLSFKIDN